ncbi:neuronal acetylcholine receptor subunit alpha-7-like [Sinocyclocheilus rhinocerous]|uniref:neuronal acetylcholine receptor subunit alpha-7-like n=1 Tax=Sinocyclocheilus rhinocerous TaxID=307959 RepID=UPI0007B7AA97|nr:PREDICTED: neuronal acetylcholine receptor subunit alpha-7-like [Sinocyclocheilus rhinocerous]
MWHSLAFTLCGISALIQVSVQGPYQRTLLNNLLKDYNRMERPVANDSQPLTVFLSMSLIQIMDVDEKNQVLTSNIWLNMHWYDHYLQWNQSEYPGVKNLRFTTDQVWTPDILLYNSADDKFDSTFKSNIVVNSSGYCNYLPPGIFTSTCNVDVRWFPFDIQKCELKFGSWTFDGWLLDLQMNEADISGYMPNGEWDLVGVPGTRNELYYDCCKEPYPDVTFVVTIRRRTLYYALNLLVPCVLLSSMTLLIFLLPADSGEKISLGITVLLSLTVFMLLVAEIMPATSDSIPLIGQYFASTMIIVGMSVIATVVVLQYHHHDPNGGNMPRWVQIVLLQWVAWFLRMKRPGESEDPERPPCAPHLRRCSSGSQSGSLPNAPGSASADLHHHHHTSSTLHPLHPQSLFQAAAAAGHTHHLHNQTNSANINGNLLYIGFSSLDEASPPSLLAESVQRNSMSGGPRPAVVSPPAIGSSPPPHLPSQFCSPPPPPTPNLEATGCPSTVSGGGGGCSCSGTSGGGDPQLQAILEEVRYVADRFRGQDENDSVAEQWKFAAAVIDRLCLVAFSVFNIICTISILMSAPNFVEAVSKDFI